MPRYIDADEYEYCLEKNMDIAENRQKKHGFRDAIKMIDLFVVDVAPVVHGEWIHEQFSSSTNKIRCSLCGNTELLYKECDAREVFPYCHCGAKMDKKSEKSKNL